MILMLMSERFLRLQPENRFEMSPSRRMSQGASEEIDEKPENAADGDACADTLQRRAVILDRLNVDFEKAPRPHHDR